MNTKKILSVLGVSALALAIVGPKVLQAATELAKVNNNVITLEDFNSKYRESIKFFQLKTPNKKNVLDDLIKRELGIQEAKKEGLDKDPEVQERMNTVLFHALIEKKLNKAFETINVSDDEAKSYYSKNPEIRISQIFVGVRPEAKPEEEKKSLEKIKAVQEKLNKGGATFTELAQKESEGFAAPMGGDTDYQNRTTMDPALYDAALKLRTPGKVSGPVRSAFGYHLVKLTAVRPWEEADRAQVKRLVFDEKRNQAFEKYMGTLRSQAKVTVHPELLKD